MAAGSLSVFLNLAGNFNTRITQAKKNFSGFTGTIDKAGSKITALINPLNHLGAALGIAGIGGLIGFGVKLANDAETAHTQFRVLTGSAEKAKAIMKELKAFSAETPLQAGEVLDAGRKLLAFGSAAENVQTQLRMLGDLSTGVGVPLGEMAEIYGKLQVQGRAFAEDINQLTGRGIPIVDALAKVLGVTKEEVKGLVTEGKIGFPEVNAAMQSLTGAGGQFENMMKEISKTTSGKLSTMKDLFFSVLRDVGQKIKEKLNFDLAIDKISQYIKLAKTSLVPIIEKTVDLFIKWGPTILRVGAAFLVFKTVLFAITAAQKALAIASAIAAAVTGNWVVLLGGLAAAASAVAVIELSFNKLVDSLDQNVDLAGEEKEAVDNLKGALDGASSSADKFKRSNDEAGMSMKEMDKAASKIRDEVTTPFDKIVEKVRLLKKLLDEGKISQETYNAAVEQQRTALDDATGGSKKFIADLEKQIRVLRMGADAANLYEMHLNGASDANLKQAAALQDQIKRIKEQRKALKEAAKARVKGLEEQLKVLEFNRDNAGKSATTQNNFERGSQNTITTIRGILGNDKDKSELKEQIRQTKALIRIAKNTEKQAETVSIPAA